MPPVPNATRSNGWFTVLGLGAPDSKDANAVGQQVYAAHIQHAQRYLRDMEGTPQTYVAITHATVDLSDLRCTVDVTDCYAHYIAHSARIQAVLQAHATFLGRYRDLSQALTLEELLPPPIRADMAPYEDLVAASEMFTMQSARWLAGAQREQGWDGLKQNASLHHRLMAGAQTGLTVLAIEVSHMRLLRLIGDALPRLKNLTEQELDKLQQLTASPLTRTSPLRGEIMRVVWDQARLNRIALSREAGPGLSDRVSLYALKATLLPNATLNKAYEVAQGLDELATVPAAQWDQRLQEMQAAAQAPRPTILPCPIRNCAGNGRLPQIDPEYATLDAQTAHHLEGYRRLVQLQIAALRERVTPQHMPDWLAAQAPALRNPYTLQPMGWDAATQSLVFEGRQAQIQNPKPRNVYRVSVYGATPKPARP